MKGVCVWFKNTYGFVKSDTTGDDYFIHESAIEMEGYRTLKSGDKVEFDVESGGPKNRLQAINVRVVK